MNIKETLYKKLEKYVKIDTASDPAATTTPSTSRQTVLAKILTEELKKLGAKNVTLTKHSYVLAELPANTTKKMPSVGFIAHLDTSPDFSGKNVKPQIHKNYKGGKLTINAAKKMFLDPAKDPLLSLCKGHDIVCASGETLLGGDDKVGIAVVMSMLQYFKENPSLKHGAIKIAFTPDEEIGHGAARLPLDKFKADFAYTIDGGVDTVGYGNFNADAAKFVITGVCCHPGSAKGVMVNPLMVAAELLQSWPKNKFPWTTDKEQGFVHFTDVNGGTDSVSVKAIVREHDIKKMYKLEKDLQALCRKLEAKNKGAKIVVSFSQQYRNMKDVLKKDPRAMVLLTTALKEAGVKYRLEQARGGTDGSQLSFRGLPTPNIMAAHSGAHGPYEWVSIDAMADIFKTCLNIVKER